MITLDGRNLIIPVDEQTIGFVGDNKTEIRIFQLSRFYEGIDLSGFDFKLDTDVNGTKNIIDLTKTVLEDKITLTWTIESSHVTLSGYMVVQIRAFQGEVECWHSSKKSVIVSESIGATSTIESPLPSEFEQMEVRVTTMKDTAISEAIVATQQAEIATTKANEASISEDNAKTSETNAKTSETEAKTSETRAKTSETNASTSEANALASQNEAKTSEDNALISEGKALASENAAKLSETNLATSEANAKTSEDNAKLSEIAAKSSEDKAKISETNAGTSELNAKDSEVKAKTSETNSGVSEATASQALADLLAMLGADVATLTGGKLTPSQIPAIAVNNTFPVANTDAMLLLTAQTGDVAVIVVNSVVTDSYILVSDDPTVLANWVKLGVSYVAEAGNAQTSVNAENANMINNHRVVVMTQAEYDLAVKDADTVYLVSGV